MASSSTSSSASLPYQPIYTPSTSSYNPSINPVHSTHAAHFRRLYDIYRLLLQRGDLERAKRAYALVVRCREFDWAMNWRDGIAMVTLPRSQQEEDGAEEGEAERLRREEELKARYLREALAVHSRGVTSFRHVREPVTILRELILHLIAMHNYNEALQEVELCANMPPFREDPSLYYYGGLVCVYLAQEEMERMRSQGAGSTQSQTQATQSGHGTSQAQRTRRGSSSGSSSSSASTSSSSSSSSTSSDEEDQTGEGNRPGGRGKGKQRRQHTQPARVFCKPVSTETMQTLERESVHWTLEARRWFEKAIEAAEEGQRAAVAAEEDGVPQWRTGVAREVDEAKRWLDLMDGKIQHLGMPPHLPTSSQPNANQSRRSASRSRASSRHVSVPPATPRPDRSTSPMDEEDEYVPDPSTNRQGAQTTMRDALSGVRFARRPVADDDDQEVSRRLQ